MATYTADAAQAGAPVRAVHTGINVMHGKYVADGVTISDGDVYQMVKVPNGAEILRLGFYGRSGGTGGVIFNLGTSANATQWGTVTVSGTQQFISVNNASATQALPYKVSLSDGAQPQHLKILLTVETGTGTATGTLGLIVEYLMPGQAGP